MLAPHPSHVDYEGVNWALAKEKGLAGEIAAFVNDLSASCGRWQLINIGSQLGGKLGAGVFGLLVSNSKTAACRGK